MEDGRFAYRDFIFITREKYSRVPVYEDNIDNFIGVMHSKYLIEYLSEDGNKENFNFREIIRQPYFVPASKRTDELFKELQHNKTHFAIIIDEYGGTAGIVTLEDLIEEIVGNIFDEDDEVERDIEKLDENTFIINGTTSLDIVKDYLKVELPFGHTFKNELPTDPYTTFNTMQALEFDRSDVKNQLLA